MFFHVVCISIVVVCVCVFSILCAFMQVRSTEVEFNSGWWICADDPTRRRFILYDMHVVILFCLCRPSKWQKANLT